MDVIIMTSSVTLVPCYTMEELQDIVAEEWKKTPLDYLASLVRSMPDRCQAVIDANGDHTTY